jgi:hypothetical protein
VPGAEWLPFGLAPAHDPKQTRDYFPRKEVSPRRRLREVYVNFSHNTVERYELGEKYKDFGWASVWGTKDVLSAGDYVITLGLNQACLCPAGNGRETHRCYEAWYCGVVPVVKVGRLAEHMRRHGLPLFSSPSLFEIQPDLIWDYVDTDPFNTADLSVLTKSYWQKQFEEAREEYL